MAISGGLLLALVLLGAVLDGLSDRGAADLRPTANVVRVFAALAGLIFELAALTAMVAAPKRLILIMRRVPAPRLVLLSRITMWGLALNAAVGFGLVLLAMVLITVPASSFTSSSASPSSVGAAMNWAIFALNTGAAIGGMLFCLFSAAALVLSILCWRALSRVKPVDIPGVRGDDAAEDKVHHAYGEPTP